LLNIGIYFSGRSMLPPVGADPFYVLRARINPVFDLPVSSTITLEHPFGVYQNDSHRMRETFEAIQARALSRSSWRKTLRTIVG
jgi:hypothetical protein